LLEIGLGCNMVYGPGKSLYIWHEYFEGVDRDIQFIELDAKCIEKYVANATKHNVDLNTKIYTGSQSDRAFLRDEVLKKAGGNFDMIIDDGGHSMTMQRTSIEELWVAVRPGGYYVIEDLHTSTSYDLKDSTPLTTDVIKHIVESITSTLPLDPHQITADPDLTKANYAKQILSIDCASKMCVFTKAF